MRSPLASGPLWLVVATAACAHPSAPTEAPGQPDALTQLRHDQAHLRKRVQLLEDRLMKMERGSERESAGLPEDRELPVVRLRPPAEDRDERRRAASPAPSSAETDPASGPAHVRLRRGVSLGPARTADPEEGPTPTSPDELVEARTPHGAQGGAPTSAAADGARSYRLVGSHLVDLTKRNAPKRPDRPQRGKAGDVMLAEYEAAMSDYRSGELARAEARFDGFARAHPAHDYADNALYWKGEAAYDLEHYADALAAFTEVVERYGGGNKAPDALLKIGLCYGRLSDLANARDVLTQLVAAYPEAKAATLAERKLAEMQP